MVTRRDYLKLCTAAGLTIATPQVPLAAMNSGRALIKRSIPGTQEQLPAVGLGSSASFARLAGEGNQEGIRDLLRTLADHETGGVFDTAPSYGAAEQVAAGVAQEAGLNRRLFWATKVNVADAGSGKADPVAVRAQLDRSIERLKKPAIDLIQIHNLGDVSTQLGILREYQAAGRVRYIGATTTFPDQYPDLERLLRNEKLDFIGVDYAVDNRTMEERIFPLAQERGVGVLVYQPFGRNRLWEKVKERKLPEWAAEYDVASWGQFFLKFTISHPAVTVATPATSQVRNLIDNLGAASGLLPDRAGRQRMVRFIESV